MSARIATRDDAGILFGLRELLELEASDTGEIRLAHAQRAGPERDRLRERAREAAQ